MTGLVWFGGLFGVFLTVFFFNAPYVARKKCDYMGHDWNLDIKFSFLIVSFVPNEARCLHLLKGV